MAGLMSAETLKQHDVVVCLKRKYINEKILDALQEGLEEMFPEETVAVGLGRDEAIKLRHWGSTEEKKVRRLVSTLGGKIGRR